MRVSFVDLGAQYAQIREEVHAALDEVFRQSSFVLGPAVTAFESDFAEYCSTQDCVGVASGADALHLALLAAGIGSGDEVITAANTFIATVNGIHHSGATPVLVDVDERSHNLNPDLLKDAITERTRAIVPVHLYGQPADMDPILAAADRHGLAVIEDAAQAHGARYKGRRTGGFGLAGCFSFYPGKNLGSAGEGGAVITDDVELAEQIRVLRNVGQSEKYVHPVPGFNSRLQSLQAAVLKVKLRYLDEWNAQRRQAAQWYGEDLGDTSLVLPHSVPDVEHVWHLYVVQCDRRDELMAFLKEQDISCGIHYPIPNHAQAAYVGVRTVPQGAPVTTRLASRVLSLPMHQSLTRHEVGYVADAVRDFERG